MSTIEIHSNYKPVPLIYGYELSEEEKAEFHYLEDVESSQFIRLHGVVYDLTQFVRCEEDGVFGKWDGVFHDCAFSGVLVKLLDCGMEVLAGYYTT